MLRKSLQGLNCTVLGQVDIRAFELGALEVFRREIEHSCSVCAARCHSSGDGRLDFDSQKVAKAFLPVLLRRIYNASRLVLAATLNNDDDKTAADPENHFRDVRQTIKLTFPLLELQVTNISREWVENTTRIVTRWKMDKRAIASVLFDADPIGHLIGLAPGHGDEHDGGEQTLILMLSCGRKLVYKPRCQRIEEKFYVVAKQLGFSEIYTPKFLCRERYGWMEFIPHVECENQDEVEAYYFRSGLLLSLLYALEAEDIHHENVISRGSQPVVVDLETLFHHRDDSTTKGTAAHTCLRLGHHTVLKTHFVPQFLLRSSDNDLSAISPLNGLGQCTKGSIPWLNGTPIPVDDFVPAFLEGFRAGYRRIVARKEALLDADGLLSNFQNTSGRYVCRTTQTYYRLINALAHPDLQADMAKRYWVIDKLDIDTYGRELLNELLDMEKSFLAKRQVPRFSHSVDRKELFANGVRVGSDFFTMSGLELAKTKIENMDESDLSGQLQLIKRSFALEYSEPLGSLPAIDTDLERLCRSVAVAIGRSVLRGGMQHQSGMIWPLYALNGNGEMCLDPTNSSLYHGYLGVSVFLANAQSIFPSLCERKLLVGLTKCQVQQAIHGHSNHHGCGAFTGASGILYVLTHFARLWAQERWIEDYAGSTLDLLDSLRKTDACLDVVSGGAGAILALVAHYAQSGEHRALQIAIEYGERLLAKFEETAQVGWRNADGRILTGFAHGSAGIGYALKLLGSVSGIGRFDVCANKALQHESDLFMTEHDNWPDNRLADGSDFAHTPMTAWCHGAVGIGLSRFKIKEHGVGVTPEYVDRDIDRALSHYFRRPFLQSDSLCHGNFGNFELPIAARKLSIIKDSQWNSLVDQLRARILRIAKSGAIKSDNSKYIDYSLMTGWSGIGYQLLRIAGVRDVPSLLSLDV